LDKSSRRCHRETERSSLSRHEAQLLQRRSCHRAQLWRVSSWPLRILLQVDENSERHVISSASRSLSEVESRYSQTEREALAIVFGCEHFHIYLYGSRFSTITDHKPLISIFGRNAATNSKHSPRIERWLMRLQPYDTEVVYKHGKDNPADYLSRHQVIQSSSRREEKIAEEYVQYVADRATPKARRNFMCYWKRYNQTGGSTK
jgi:hypothetical protein